MRTKTMAGVGLAATALVGWMGLAGAASNGTYMKVVAASELIGLDVETSDGQEAGEIEYLLISGSTGKARYALLTLEDDMEIGEDELVALPFAELDIASVDDDDITVNVSMKKLEGATRLKEGQLADFTQPMMITQIYEYYGTPEEDRISAHGGSDRQTGKEAASKGDDQSQAEQRKTASTGGKDPSKSKEQSQREGKEQSKSAKEQYAQAGSKEQRRRNGERGERHVVVASGAVTTLVPGMVEARNMLGADVHSAREEFGEIDEIVLSADTGQVLYVLISDGGFLGIGDDWYALPMQTLTWNDQEEAYITDVPLKDDGATRKFTRNEDDLPRRIRRAELESFYESFGVNANLMASQ